MRCIALLNRADPDMLQFMQYNINQCDASKGETYRLAKEFGQKLIDNTREVIGKPPMYKDSCRSALIFVPFNQASKQDVEALVNYIYSNLGMDLDYILPFVGIIPENGREIDKLDNKSELTHRVMLTSCEFWGLSRTRKQAINLSLNQLKS